MSNDARNTTHSAYDPNYDPTNDIGGAQFDEATAAVTHRDTSLFLRQPITVLQGPAPKGFENQALAWNQFQHTTEDRNLKEEKKSDIGAGQLHRQNKAARIMTGEEAPLPARNLASRGGCGSQVRRGGRGGGRGGGQADDDGKLEPLCAGRKPPGAPVLPLAKGIPEELDKSMFWEEKIC